MKIVLVLNNIRSIYNVASIFRTTDGAGVSKIYLVGVTPTPMDRFGKLRPDFSKVALGAEKTMAWEYFKNFGAVYKKLRSDGYEILAVEQNRKSIPYFKYRPKKNENLALIFGEETKGLPKSVLNKVDKILEIPMRGTKESLNVSVATGIVVYDLAFRVKMKTGGLE